MSELCRHGAMADLCTFCKRHGLPVNHSYSGIVPELQKRIKELERSERELAEQRDHAEEWADKLAEAIALHFREDIGEHSNLNNPWAHAHNLIAGTFCR